MAYKRQMRARAKRWERLASNLLGAARWWLENHPGTPSVEDVERLRAQDGRLAEAVLVLLTSKEEENTI